MVRFRYPVVAHNVGQEIIGTLTVAFLCLLFSGCEGRTVERVLAPHTTWAQTVKRAEPRGPQCSASTSISPTTQASPPAFCLARTNDGYNDIGLCVSGIRVSEKSELFGVTKDVVWRQYAAGADIKWSRFNKNRIARISKWAREELAGIRQDTKTLFYPFSGPDFVYASTLFPDADTYVLVGLEPVGSVPDLKKMQENSSLVSFFKMLDRAIDDCLTISFFKTNDMVDEMNCKAITGTMPVLMLFLARTGNQIVDIKPLHLDSSGTIAYQESSLIEGDKKRSAKGVEITFRHGNETGNRRLYYFSADISNRGLSKNQGLQMFLENMDGSITTFVKSASYLMYKGYFSSIRKIILTKSRAILQDDSAIPYRFFDRSLWDITLYGTYDGPIKMFKEHYEKDLKAAYAENTKKLNFRLGYARQTNLLLARKKNVI